MVPDTYFPHDAYLSTFTFFIEDFMMSTESSAYPASSSSTNFGEQARQTAERVAGEASVVARDSARHFVREPAKDLLVLAKEYARENPDVAACWAFGLGVVVGWKLRS
jgi:hypothetical protein